MRITVSHNKGKEEAIRSVDRSFDDLFRWSSAIPVQIVNEQKTWTGSTLTFALRAKMGVVSTPVKGTILVTERDLTIEADFGLLEKLLSGPPGRQAIEGKIRGLLR